MLESETRRQILLAAIQGLCANEKIVTRNDPAAIVQFALKVAFEVERQAPGELAG